MISMAASCAHLESSTAPDGGTSTSTSGSSGTSGTSNSASSGGTSPGDTVVSGDSGSTVVAAACSNSTASDPFAPGYTPGSEVGEAQSQVGSMPEPSLATLMAGQVPACSNPNFNVFSTPGASGVQGLQLRDGPRGVNMIATAQNQSCPNYFNCGSNNHSTTFPTPSGRAASFDLSLEQQVGSAIGDEMAAAKLNVLLAPVINILRHPAWGRSQETYGEDSYLVGRMGSAFISGVQQYVAACAKHFAGYNIENGRTQVPMINVAQMDEQTFYEVYGRHFEMAVQDGGVACIMAAYNNLQVTSSGTVYPCTGDPLLLTTMLRTTFGFKGWVLTDWWAMLPGNGTSCLSGQQVSTAQTETAQAVNAGLDMELPWDQNFTQLLPDVQAGQLSLTNLQTSVSRLLAQQIRFNIASPGSTGLKTPTTSVDGTNSIVSNASHVQLAYQAALEGMVLLKNANASGQPVLPIPSSAKTVAVIAAAPASVPFQLNTGVTAVNGGNVDFANDVRTGDLGSSRTFVDTQSFSPLAGIKAAAPSGVTVVSGTSASAASSADFVVVVAGLTPEDEGEGYTGPNNLSDRLSFDLDDKNVHNHAMSPVQDPLIEAVAALGKPMVVVLEGGSVINVSNWLSSVPAVVMAWYPGQQGGRALGDLLFGNPTSGGTSPGVQANFSGKLPVTWANYSDLPALSAGIGATTVMDYYLGYRYFDHNPSLTPVFPFGSGLSYSKFSYANLQVPCTTVTTGAIVNVQADVTNTGTLDGDEVTFLFVSYPNTQQRRSVKELKGFHRATIKAGQTVRITIPLRVEDLKYWNSTDHKWEWENGTVNIMVGGSSTSLPLTGSITVSN